MQVEVTASVTQVFQSDKGSRPFYVSMTDLEDGGLIKITFPILPVGVVEGSKVQIRGRVVGQAVSGGGISMRILPGSQIRPVEVSFSTAAPKGA